MKDAYYFPHDSNARNDQNVMLVRMKYGMKGYGIYFGIVEMLREANGYQMPSNFVALAYDLREDAKEVEDIVKNFNLFIIKDDYFYSESLLRRMERLDNIRQKRKESGHLGGIAKAKQVVSIKVKESKVNNIKPTIQEIEDYCKERNNGIDAETFFHHYESCGWKIGNKPMRSWRSAIITWEKRRGKNEPESQYRKLG